VTPGIGLAWFAFRGEWRRLAIALGVTGVIAGVSIVLEPELWVSWVQDSLLATATGTPTGQPEIAIPLWLRLPAALLVVAWGARTDRAWTVPVAATIAVPVLWPSSLAVLAALWPIAQRRRALTDDRTTLGYG
jgi:predicted branched-subunit amino acid permease